MIYGSFKVGSNQYDLNIHYTTNLMILPFVISIIIWGYPKIPKLLKLLFETGQNMIHSIDYY